jgi:exo-beta-1,3-glucanase (GH17 family)
MNFNQIKSLFAASPKLAFAALALTATALLVACGGGGSVAVDAPQTAVATTNLRALPAEYLARKAVSYSPFRTGDRANEKATLSDTVMKAHITEDLNLLVAGNFRLIRLFDSSDEVTRRTLEVIKRDNLDIRVHLGAYVNSYKYVYNPTVNASIKAENQAELDRLIGFATNPDYKDIILAVSVGNETMVNWSSVPIDPADMAGYISYVRAKVTQPVTTDDNFLFYAEIPQRISDLIDFASIHTYTEIDTQYPASPYFWDWRQEGVPIGADGDKTARAAAMMNAAMVATRAQYQMVRDSLDRKGLRNIPIVIGETGWNAVDLGKLRFRASPVNQKMYFSRLETWRAEGRVGPGPANVFYFEAFDEPWKGGDDGWGLFNLARQARCVVQALSATYTPEPGVSCADADVAAFVTPVANAPFAAATYSVLDSTTALPVTGLNIDAFDGNSATRAIVTPNPLSADGGKSLLITPTPKDYGWGLLFYNNAVSENLSSFATATGKVNVLVKTAYPGKFEIGVSTDTALGETQEAYIQIGSGSYGYINDDNWHLVSIPVLDFVAVNSKLDFSRVLSRFVIADRYAYTGKANGSNITDPMTIDGIAWTK